MTGEAGEANVAPRTPEAGERKTSLLVQVREKLKSNKDVFFAGEVSFGPLSGVNIFVAPNKPIYEAQTLNRFMDSMTPEIPFSARDEVVDSAHIKDSLSVGRLYYDDVLGKKQRMVVETVSSDIPAELQQIGINLGERKYTESEDIKRRTWVHVYPDIAVAKAAAEYERKMVKGEIEAGGVSRDSYLKNFVTRADIARLNK